MQKICKVNSGDLVEVNISNYVDMTVISSEEDCSKPKAIKVYNCYIMCYPTPLYHPSLDKGI